MSINKQDVIIVGGGCGGLWLAYWLNQHKISCTVLDGVGNTGNAFASYASTRNQGWLQSGAFYLAMEKPDDETAIACRTGYHYVRHFAPEALLPRVPCYYLFQNEQERDDVLDSCSFLDIYARKVKDFREVHDQTRTSLLEGSRLEYAAETLDGPINTTKMLTKLIKHLRNKGVRFNLMSSLDNLSATWSKAGWKIQIEDGSILHSSALVLASGTHIPDLLQRFLLNNPPPQDEYVMTKIPVLVMKGDISRAMLLSPKVTAGPQLVPFGVDKGERGVTVCLLRVDKDIQDPNDFFLPELDADGNPDDGSMRDYARQLLRWFPGIESMVAPQKRIRLPIHFYVCQKLKLRPKSSLDAISTVQVSRGHIWRPYTPSPDASPSLFAFYPGKFTAAPVAAQSGAENLEASLGWTTRSSLRLNEASWLPQIARQKYYDESTHYLRMSNGGLKFEPL